MIKLEKKLPALNYESMKKYMIDHGWTQLFGNNDCYFQINPESTPNPLNTQPTSVFLPDPKGRKWEGFSHAELQKSTIDMIAYTQGRKPIFIYREIEEMSTFRTVEIRRRVRMPSREQVIVALLDNGFEEIPRWSNLELQTYERISGGDINTIAIHRDELTDKYQQAAEIAVGILARINQISEEETHEQIAAIEAKEGEGED